MAAELVLVTGAGGFIGSYLVDALVREGKSVRAFVRYNSRSDDGFLHLLPQDIYSGLEIVRGDLRDPDAVDRAISGCDAVYHLGAQISIPYSYVHPVDFAQTNVLGTCHVLTACLRNGNIRRIVHTSTSEVYGTAQTTPMTEAHPLCAQSPYAASKIGADMLAESYYRSYNLPVVTVRPFNTFGPRQSTRAIVPTILTQILTSSKVILGSLDVSRDLTYVTDTVAGFLKAGYAEDVVGSVINLGTGKDVSIAALTHLAAEALGRDVKIISKSERKRPESSEVEQLCADASRARAVLGWEPVISLRDGLRTTAHWIQANLDLYNPEQYDI